MPDTKSTSLNSICVCSAQRERGADEVGAHLTLFWYDEGVAAEGGKARVGRRRRRRSSSLFSGFQDVATDSLSGHKFSFEAGLARSLCWELRLCGRDLAMH